MANARSKSEQADQAATLAAQDSEIARMKAKEYAPDFIQPGMYSHYSFYLLKKKKIYIYIYIYLTVGKNITKSNAR